MKTNDIIFADLSTYTPQKTIAFYETIFEWKYYKSDDYFVAHKEFNEIVGLYATPDKFKAMGMPHFWMTYIQVNDVEQTVKIAKEMGGIIELVELGSPIGKIALIRDPQGAGFTIYEGDKLKTNREGGNALVWSEIHVSNAAKVIPFYEAIFNWKFEKENPATFKISNHKDEHIADIQEIPNEYKGKYEYWVCTFAVDNLEQKSKLILENGGELISEEDNRILFTDNSGEAFFYLREK